MTAAIVPTAGRTTEVAPRSANLARRLERLWQTPSGLYGWISSVDHKDVGRRYIITALLFLGAGGIEALVMRLQLMAPNQQILTPSQYNQLFSTHAATMMFWYALPILSGFSNFLWPLIFGARDMAFPRLNALSYWVFLLSGIIFYAGVLTGHGPNDGWFNYVPLASKPFNPDINIDVYALALILLGISTTVGAANFVVTFLHMRAPGMTIGRVPMLSWGTLTASVANLLVVPAVSLAFFLLWMDRQFGTHFFDVSQGGQPLLWQHLFWLFAHPWVYAIVLPAMAMVSEGLPTFCRRPLVGYVPVALSTVATMALGFGVWVHHMFATGLPGLTVSFFSGASIIIAVPSSIAVFAWTATIWLGRPVITTAFLYFASTIVLFVIGGVSGFMTAAAPVDWQLTDTYFIVAHIHYVTVGINVFPVIGGLYYWFPKLTGRMLNERIGRWNFWLIFIGFNITFLPMHLTGLFGMPRRVYTYANNMGWNTLNLVCTVGAFILTLGFIILLVDLVISARRGQRAGDNPWGASGLEWATSSPPPAYNFIVIPQVSSLHPLWEEQLHPTGERSVVERGLALDHGRETIATTTLEATPDLILKMPNDTPVPFMLSLAMTGILIGLLLHFWLIAITSTAIATVLIVIWFWPERRRAQSRCRGIMSQAALNSAELPLALPVGAAPQISMGRAGITMAIATEGALFCFLLFFYYYCDAHLGSHWRPAAVPDLRLALPNTGILLLSSVTAWFGERAIKRGARKSFLAIIAATILLGGIFVTVQVFEWFAKSFTIHSSLYGSLYFVITGFHMAHVVVGLIGLILIFLWSALGYLGRYRHEAVSIVSTYWHFVDAVWIAVFLTFYMMPRYGL